MAGLKKNLKELQPHLSEGEEVLAHVFGAYETKIMGNDSLRNGLMAATNKRLIFFAKKTFGFDMEMFEYSNISSVEASKSMMGHTITFFASGNKASLKWIHEGDVPAFIETVRAKSSKPAPASSAPAPDVYDQLDKLAALKDKGILNEHEYETKKQALLAKI